MPESYPTGSVGLSRRKPQEQWGKAKPAIHPYRPLDKVENTFLSQDALLPFLENYYNMLIL